MNKSDVILNNYFDFFDKNERKIEIPKHVIHVCEKVFMNNTKLKKVTFHQNIKKIETSAFENCENLEVIKIYGDSKLVVIPERCFAGCKSLKSFDIPDEVGVIKKYAFKDCTSITQIEIPETVISIESGAFDKWTEDQTIIMHRNFKFGMVCKAKIINLSQTDDEVSEDEIFETASGKYMYSVLCKCGHVGRHRYMPVEFPVYAETKKEAAAIARAIPRVKHDHKFAILKVEQISKRAYDLLVKKNSMNPYLKTGSKHEQNKISDYINENTIPEKNYKRRD